VRHEARRVIVAPLRRGTPGARLSPRAAAHRPAPRSAGRAEVPRRVADDDKA